MVNVLTLVSVAFALSLPTEHAVSAPPHPALRLAQHKDLSCGELVTIPSVSLEGGHTNNCFQEKPVSYEYCRMMLQQSPSCSALTYSRGNCWIHDRSKRDFTIESQPRVNAASLSIVKLDGAMGECNSSGAKESTPSALARFETCMRQGDDTDVSKLPLLAIVISVTQRWAQANNEELNAVASNLQCYCEIHGYSFHLNIMKDMNTYRFFHQRHTVVAEKYLSRYQWVLVLDADVLVVNLEKSLQRFLSSSEDVLLQMREGGEVAASSYFLRNSKFSYCFLELWRAMSPPNRAKTSWVTTPNHDNGDLVAAVMLLISPRTAINCASWVKTRPVKYAYDRGMLLCFRVFRGALADLSRGFGQFANKIKVFFIQEGFARLHTGPFNENIPARGSKSIHAKNTMCHPSTDIFAHGWKRIATALWKPRQFSCWNCSASKSSSSSNVCPPVPLKNEMCHWLTPEEEFEISRDFCFWKSPLCAQNDSARTIAEMFKRTTESSNTCASSERCRGEILNLQRWRLCFQYDRCSPVLTLQAVRSAMHNITHCESNSRDCSHRGLNK